LSKPLFLRAIFLREIAIEKVAENVATNDYKKVAAQPSRELLFTHIFKYFLDIEEISTKQ